DGVGTLLGATSITAVDESGALEKTVRPIAGAFPGVLWVEPWVESNHSTFAFRGIPVLALTSEGTRALAHQPFDDLENMSAEKLEEAASLAERIVCTLIEK
ncbi:MAG: hypothetical protein R6W69_00705, partial [Anaerolineales bacterium]